MMVNGKIALPPQSQAMPVGPASKVYTIPPRPKPGRKPKEPAADDIRKEQNRAAQKKFRNKQHDRIQALNEEVGQRDVELTTLRIEVNNLNNALALAHSQIEAMRQQIFTLEMEREADRINLKRQADEVKRESKRRRSAQQPSEAPAFDNRSVVDQTGADIPMSDSMVSVLVLHIPEALYLTLMTSIQLLPVTPHLLTRWRSISPTSVNQRIQRGTAVASATVATSAHAR